MITNLNSPQTPPLYDTLMALKREVMQGLRCCVPGQITALNVADGTVDVQVSLMQQNTSGISVPYPELRGCPVVTIQGGGVAAIMPIQVGDSCLVFFSDRCIDAWFQTGSPQPLPNLRMHDLSDGFALVGLNSMVNPILTPLLVGEGGIAESEFATGAKVALNPATHLITIKNGTQSLFTIMTTLTTTLTALNTTLATMTTASIASGATQTAIATYTATFTSLITQIAGLLY